MLGNFLAVWRHLVMRRLPFGLLRKRYHGRTGAAAAAYSAVDPPLPRDRLAAPRLDPLCERGAGANRSWAFGSRPVVAGGFRAACGGCASRDRDRSLAAAAHEALGRRIGHRGQEG